MRKKVPKATHSGTIEIGDMKIPCHVLEDGRRVLVQRKMVKALGMARGSAGKGGGDRLSHFISGKGISPFVNNELHEVIKEPALFKTAKGSTAYCYEAAVLADICDAVLEANKEGKLQKQQEHIAEQCEILMRGFARIGIIALVDEATGYQYDRDRKALEIILETYIAKELLPWAKRFPDEFYRQLFRLRGWQYSPLSVKRPKFVGKLTNQLIYQKLPPGILEELREKNPVTRRGYRQHRHHQFLTEDIGNPHLERHIASVTTLMRAAANWRNFERLFHRAFPSGPQQTEFNFVEEVEEKST